MLLTLKFFFGAVTRTTCPHFTHPNPFPLPTQILRVQVAESVEKHESWINSKSAEQAKRPKFEPPVVTVAEIEAAKVC